jgi:hypothetical protein
MSKNLFEGPLSRTTGVEPYDLETVRRVVHRVNCHQRWPKFRADDFEANTLPKSERRTEQEHGCKAGNI